MAEGPDNERESVKFLFAANEEAVVMVISEEAVRQLKKGGVIIGPSGNIFLMYSHDIKETMNQMDLMVSCTGAVDTEVLKMIVEENAKLKKKRKKKTAELKTAQE